MAASSKTANIIVCCNCGDTPKFSQDAFKLLFPDEELSGIYIGKEKIVDLAEKFSFESDLSKYLRALARNKDKYSYYFQVENGEIKKQYNLFSGSRLI